MWIYLMKTYLAYLVGSELRCFVPFSFLMILSTKKKWKKDISIVFLKMI